MLRFYYSAAPNPTKVALFLEESGLPYEAIPVDTRKGDQHKLEFSRSIRTRKFPPSSMATPSCSTATRSCFISPRKRQFAGKHPKARGVAVVADVVASASVLGQAVHFRNYAPEKLPTRSIATRLRQKRHFGILDERLAKQRYMLGDTYTIVDMDVWGWARPIPNIMGESAWDKFKNLKRLVDEIRAQPAAQRAVALKDKHKFKTEMDSEALNAMFPHLKEKVA